ncbi:D-alanine--D-alanine ligase [Myxococcota bacterium]|nr:D-alanine--D-alanine ligase [Myxococcota bacterium]MBU1381109.1 D-alanine--D-alanine ligase [Myxococcota bacterium]MBU1496534.1 D-alanine--D-alanine ligase [Myxococcota bacterium]
MIIGFTYDLKDDYLAMGMSEEDSAEFDKIETIIGIETAINATGHECVRIGNVQSLVRRLALGERWDLVFNICEGVSGIGRESQVPALLEAYSIPYVFSDPLVLSLTLHKGMTKHIVKSFGIPTPDFFVVKTEEDISRVVMEYPLFVKPVAEGTGKGISARSLCTTHDDLRESCIDLLRRFNQSVLVERYLPGREFTVGIVGTGDRARVVGMMEITVARDSDGSVYGYHNKENYEEIVSYRPVYGDKYDLCATVALSAYNALGCQDAGRVDLKDDHFGIPNFIEVNPLAGLNPVHSDLPILARMYGIEYDELISMILSESILRNNIQPSEVSIETVLQNSVIYASNNPGKFFIP